MMTEIQRAKWERRFQSVMTTVIAAGLIWGVSTVAELDKSVARLADRVNALDVRTARMYPAAEAAKDYLLLAQKDAEQDRRLEHVEARVSSLEGHE